MMGIVTFFVLLMIGLLGGTLAGFLGVGGGIIFVPTLFELAQKLGLNGKQALVFTIANSLVLTLVSGLSGSYKQYKTHNFFWRTSAIMGIAGALASVLVAVYIVPQAWYDKGIFAKTFSAMLLLGVYKIWSKSVVNTKNLPENTFKIAIIGAFAGGIAALSGLGGGIVMIPLMTVLLGYPIKKATSVSLGAIVPISVAMVVYYSLQKNTIPTPYGVGIIDFLSILPLAIGVVVGAPRGVALSSKLPETFVRYTFIILAAAVVIRLNFFD
jgi:uncharacterized membrane protein YfcA